MSDDNVIDMQSRINRMRNLRPYRGKTDDEIRKIIESRGVKTPRNKKPVDTYEKMFDEKLSILQTEYAVDMNNSNDVENLKNLVRHQIQLERVTTDIDTVQQKEALSIDDYKNLKSLGDFQRNIIITINDLQNNLGISRKQRKEKAEDDIPRWIDGILAKSKEFMDRKTTQIYCPKCQIELARFWLNFNDSIGAVSREPLHNEVSFSLQCWKCEEQVEHIQ